MKYLIIFLLILTGCAEKKVTRKPSPKKEPPKYVRCTCMDLPKDKLMYKYKSYTVEKSPFEVLPSVSYFKDGRYISKWWIENVYIHEIKTEDKTYFTPDSPNYEDSLITFCPFDGVCIKFPIVRIQYVKRHKMKVVNKEVLEKVVEYVERRNSCKKHGMDAK